MAKPTPAATYRLYEREHRVSRWQSLRLLRHLLPTMHAYPREESAQCRETCKFHRLWGLRVHLLGRVGTIHATVEVESLEYSQLEFAALDLVLTCIELLFPEIKVGRQCFSRLLTVK